MTQTVLVTGAASGLGKTIAASLLEQGFQVVLTDVDAGRARQAADELQAADKALKAVLDDVNAAMTLKNRVVSIARADVTLPDGQYFQQDLLGIAVETDAGEPLGTLREILDLPRGSVYVVQGDREVLIPDRPEFVCSIDPAAGRMVVHLIEGM